MSSRSISILVICLLGMSCDREQPAAPPDRPAQASTDAASTDAAEPNPSPDPRLVIDSHVHLNFGAYRSYLQITSELGIVRAINLSGGYGKMPVSAHLSLPATIRNRIAPFMNMNWEGVEEPGFGEKRANELDIAVAHGYAGLKVSKRLGLGVRVGDELLAVDDRRLDPIWKKAAELGVPVAIHTGDPKAFFEPPGPENERHAELSAAPSWSFHGEEFPSRKSLLEARDRLLKRHPDTRFILVHFANNPEDLDDVERILRTYPNTMVDLSARVAEIGRHDPERVRRLFVEFHDRILFGTDLQYSLGRRADGQLAYNLTLGSISEEERRLEHIPAFYQSHFDWLEAEGEPIEHPIPIQGDWKVHPIDLPVPVLHAIYRGNAESRIFAPWLGRTLANDRARRARALAEAAVK